MRSTLARLPHPRTARSWVIACGVATLAGLAGAFALAYFVLLGGTSPPPLTLGTSTSTPSVTLLPGQVPGTWTVGSGSVAGYRVREQLADLPAQSDAVGRTSSVTGTMTLEASSTGYTVGAAGLEVDVSTLKSDRDMRDERIHSIGLESDRFPRASFTLTSAITLPTTATNGAELDVSAVGDLMIHGTTKRVTIPLKARFTGSEIEVVGSITFPFADFRMSPPSIGGFVSVQDNATMEFDLHLSHG
jgi:polyisoprenoid-binding protein YceI